MKSNFTMGSKIEAEIVKAPKVNGRFGVGTFWEWEQWRKTSRRSNSYLLVDDWSNGNICTNEGITHALDIIFSDGTQKTNWYIALFNDDYTPLATNTYQAPGYTESVNYDEGSRVLWQEGGVAAKAITNSANRATFTMNASETIYGGSLVSSNTKGDSVSGEVLFCSARFATSKKITNEDELKVTITITGSDV